MLNKTDNGHWTDAKKTEAVKTYLLIGNVAMTARMLDIPEVTVRLWRKEDWWKDAVTEIRHSGKVELTGKLRKIVEASVAVIEDRIVNGDFVFDQKTGEVVRKPVNLKDAHKVAIDMVDRQNMLDKEVDGASDSTGTKNIAASIEKLAEAFANFAAKTISKE